MPEALRLAVLAGRGAGVDGWQVGGCLCLQYPQGQGFGVEGRRRRLVEGQRDEDGERADEGITAERRFTRCAAGFDPVGQRG